MTRSKISNLLNHLKKHFFFFALLLVVSVSLPTPGISASLTGNTFLHKIGPLLRKSIEDSAKTPADKETDTRLSEANKAPKQLHKVIVVIKGDDLKALQPGVIDELRKRVVALGGHIGNHAYNNVQVWIPLDKIENLVEWSEIIRIDEPLVPQTKNVISEGSKLIGAINVNNRGLKGNGVKVGVIDLGFKDYSTLLGTELPTSVTTKVMGIDADFASNVHGTACAEIIHDIAPEAELFLVNAGDYDVDFHNAVFWLQSQGVNIISSSIGINLKLYIKFLYLSLQGSSEYALSQIQYLDRIKSQWDNTINRAISDGGITWVQAAGNDGQKAWSGPFTDSNSDYYLNFSSAHDYNEIDVSSAQSGDELYVLLIWGADTGFVTYDDYDLIVTDVNGSEMCSSEIRQGIFPIGMEACKFSVEPSMRHFAWVLQWWARPQNISIFLGHDKFPKFEYYTPAETVILSPPAHNENVITVGAVHYNTPYIIEPYSSQGPNLDGNIKPDLVAPDCVSTISYGFSPFCGTSAAAPHVAGVSALLRQAYPAWLPSQIKNYLINTATDFGIPGKDNIYGGGVVFLNTLIMKGDINQSATLDLEDAILAIQVSSLRSTPSAVHKEADVDGDHKIGGTELIYILQSMAQLRNPVYTSHSPTLNPIGNKSIDEGSILNFFVSATDDWNHSLTFSTSPLPTGASFDAITKKFSWIPSDSQSGIYNLTFLVDDGYGGSDSEAITITVHDKIPYNQQQTERLLGTWSISYTIISTFTDSYQFNSVKESTVSPGTYNALGTNQYGSLAIGAYDPVYQNFSIYLSSTIFDQFFVFNFTSNSTISGCYYQIDKNSQTWSQCFPMTGFRSSDYKDKEYLDPQFYYQAKDGERGPTEKALAISFELFP